MSDSSSSGNKKRALAIASIVFLILMIGPIFLCFSYQNDYNNLTAQVMAQQQTVASITATAIKIKLDRLVGIAEEMASSTKLVSFAADNQWTEAADVTRDLQNNTSFYDPYIDRVVLWDRSGIEQSAYPMLSSGVGSSATSSAWFQAINNGAPFYLSLVTQRAAVPRINVINIAASIKNNGVLVGTLVIQVPTTDFLEFGEGAALGTYGFIYIIDPNGNVVIHPKFPSNNGVSNLSSIPNIRTILTNKQNVSVITDEGGAESIISYQAVPFYDWEVVTQEPYAEAFSTRNSLLWLASWEIIAATLIDLLIACAILFFMTAKDRNLQKIRRVLAQ
jgi:methyl-accepting chemotaxis protein